jgi:hypothetical protein
MVFSFVPLLVFINFDKRITFHQDVQHQQMPKDQLLTFSLAHHTSFELNLRVVTKLE